MKPSNWIESNQGAEQRPQLRRGGSGKTEEGEKGETKKNDVHIHAMLSISKADVNTFMAQINGRILFFSLQQKEYCKIVIVSFVIFGDELECQLLKCFYDPQFC